MNDPLAGFKSAADAIGKLGVSVDDMPSPAQEIHEQIALTIARRADEVVRKVLNERLGYSDWTPAEIEHRVVFIAEKNGSGTYELDGTPILWLGPVRFNLNDDGVALISMDREWR